MMKNFKLNDELNWLTPSGDDDSDDRNPDDEPPTPSCMDYIMHFLTLFWKIIFAFIPPTGEKYLLKMLEGNFQGGSQISRKLFLRDGKFLHQNQALKSHNPT